MDGKEVDLKPLWVEILAIYEEIRKICERHQLRFFAIGGTALGAVRHKGFIPWDDDFDIGMPRKDYDLFMAYADKELPPHLKTVTQKNMPTYPYMFGKVQDIRKDISDGIKERTGHPQAEGIYVDVFPFDGMRLPTLADRIYSRFLRIRKNLLSGSRAHTLSAKIGRILAWLTIWVPGPRTLKEINDVNYRRATKYSFDGSDFVGHYTDGKCAFMPVFYDRREWFDRLVWMDFETTKVLVPAEYDKMLRTQYGDYMQLPPEDQRRFTHYNEPIAAWRYGPVESDK